MGAIMTIPLAQEAFAIWMVYSTLFSPDPKPTLDDNRFHTYAECQSYLGTRYDPSTIEGFGLTCYPHRIVAPTAEPKG
jgi:hypothetical protein